MTSPFNILLTACLLTSACSANTSQHHLVSVRSSTFRVSLPPRVEQITGNGICINQNCSVVATAYHVQMLAGKAKLTAAGTHTEKVLSLADDSDSNKSDIRVGMKTSSYNIAKDVSFVYTRHPVPHKSGVLYSYTPHVGQIVTVAGYHNHRYEEREARVIGSNVPLVFGQAQLAENVVVDIYLNRGTSGSAVLDQQGRLLGMIVLSGAIHLGSGDLTASVALPTRAIAKALVKLDPAVGSLVFNDIPEEEATSVLAPRMVHQQSDVPEDTSPIIPGLSSTFTDVPNSVARLRSESDAASKFMVNLLAKQCLVQGTQKPICHELSIIGGQQTFRTVDKNGKLGEPTASFPIQKHGVWTQSDWADKLGAIADNPWVFQGTVDGHYLFTFRSVAEDDRCYWEEYPQGLPLFGGGHPDWKGSVACFEQVLTDKNYHVVSIFVEMHPPDGCLTELVQQAIYYDWIKLEGLQSPVLLPVMERITARVLRQKDLWYATVFWTDYRKFRANHKIRF